MAAAGDTACDRPQSRTSEEEVRELVSWGATWTANDPLAEETNKNVGNRGGVAIRDMGACDPLPPSITASEAEEEEDEDAPLPDTEPGLPEEEDWDDEDFDDDFDDDFEDELDQELERELAERFGGDDNAILEEDEEIDEEFVDEDSEVEEPKEVEEEKEKE
jgi:hypothetical protein